MAHLSGYLPNLRRMYRAGPHRKLIGADLCQVELWMMAAISGDPVLLRNLQSGDVYTEDAKYLFALPEHLKKCSCKEKTWTAEGPRIICQAPTNHLKPKARQDAKQTHLACQYYILLPKFYRLMLEADINTSFQHCANLYNGFHKLYAGTFAWGEEELARAHREGCSRGRILGITRTYPQLATMQEAMNYPVQTTAAELFGLILQRLGSGIRPRWGQPAGLLWERFGGEAQLV